MLTLTYVYADQTAVVGPLATYAEPHAYDLCEAHGQRLSAPRGWEVMRLGPDPSTLPPNDGNGFIGQSGPRPPEPERFARAERRRAQIAALAGGAAE